MNESDSRSVSIHEAPSRLTQAVRWFREKTGAKSEGTIKEMIEEALESEEAGADSTISAEEKSLLKNMINFGELTARDVMVPRSDILGIQSGAELGEIKNQIIDIGHTRIPVFDESLDHIEGFIHVKDLFPHLVSGLPFQIREVLREILFIPPSMRIVDLLMKMRVSGCHIAIVVDEFGGTDGLVTMEDLFEELVGEIQDEHDGEESAPIIRWIGDHILEADARAPVERLSEELGVPLYGDGSGEVNTLGGLVFQALGRVPTRGEVVMLTPTLKAEILAADPRRIRQVRLTKITS